MIKQYYQDGDLYHYRFAFKPTFAWQLSSFASWLSGFPECKLSAKDGYLIAEFSSEKFFNEFVEVEGFYLLPEDV